MKFQLMRSRTAREISRAPIRVDIFSSKIGVPDSLQTLGTLDEAGC